jgi:ribonuclease I
VVGNSEARVDKDALYRWLDHNGFKRQSVMGPGSSLVSHEWERHCTQCPMISFVFTDPHEYGEHALQRIFEQGQDIVQRCGHLVE